jgi:hypothetical protein
MSLQCGSYAPAQEGRRLPPLASPWLAAGRQLPAGVPPPATSTAVWPRPRDPGPCTGWPPPGCRAQCIPAPTLTRRAAASLPLQGGWNGHTCGRVNVRRTRARKWQRPDKCLPRHPERSGTYTEGKLHHTGRVPMPLLPPPLAATTSLLPVRALLACSSAATADASRIIRPATPRMPRRAGSA